MPSYFAPKEQVVTSIADLANHYVIRELSFFAGFDKRENVIEGLESDLIAAGGQKYVQDLKNKSRDALEGAWSELKTVAEKNHLPRPNTTPEYITYVDYEEQNLAAKAYNTWVATIYKLQDFDESIFELQEFYRPLTQVELDEHKSDFRENVKEKTLVDYLTVSHALFDGVYHDNWYAQENEAKRARIIKEKGQEIYQNSLRFILNNVMNIRKQINESIHNIGESEIYWDFQSDFEGGSVEPGSYTLEEISTIIAEEKRLKTGNIRVPDWLIKLSDKYVEIRDNFQKGASTYTNNIDVFRRIPGNKQTMTPANTYPIMTSLMSEIEDDRFGRGFIKNLTMRTLENDVDQILREGNLNLS